MNRKPYCRWLFIGFSCCIVSSCNVEDLWKCDGLSTLGLLDQLIQQQVDMASRKTQMTLFPLNTEKIAELYNSTHWDIESIETTGFDEEKQMYGCKASMTLHWLDGETPKSETRNIAYISQYRDGGQVYVQIVGVLGHQILVLGML